MNLQSVTAQNLFDVATHWEWLILGTIAACAGLAHVLCVVLPQSYLYRLDSTTLFLMDHAFTLFKDNMIVSVSTSSVGAEAEFTRTTTTLSRTQY